MDPTSPGGVNEATPQRAIALLVILVNLVACTGAPAPSPSFEEDQPVLGISNGTTMPVSLFVNGHSVGTATPGVAMPAIAVASLPPLPWTVEARSPSGRTLTSMTVLADSMSSTTTPNGGRETKRTMGRVDLSCGRLTIWAGYDEPSGPAPAPSAGSPGDCAP
jgi:hypothetical protein